MRPFKHRHTSINEIPTLQTSAWIPYCSPDILSGCGAQTSITKCKNNVGGSEPPLLTHIFTNITKISLHETKRGHSPPYMH